MTRDIHEQQRAIRDSFDGGEYTIQMPADSDVVSHTIQIEKISCSENTRSIRYRLRKAIFGSNGDTSISLTFIQRLRNHDGIPKSQRVPDILEELQSHPWYNEADLLVHPPKRGSLIVDIYSSKPEKVEDKLIKFVETIETVLVSKYTDRNVMILKSEIKGVDDNR